MDPAAAHQPAAVYAKTATGQQEMQQRTLRLPPLPRRLLVLVDGKRTVAELATLVPGHDVAMLLDDLIAKECIEVVPSSLDTAPEPAPARALAPPAPAAPAGQVAPGPTADADPLAALPPPEYRSAQQVEMARNFMINTINTMLEQNSRLTLVGQIFASQGAAELRQHFVAWEAAIGSNWMGARRLPELRKKLFAVL